MMNKTTNMGSLKKSTTSQLQQQSSYLSKQIIGSSVGSTKNGSQPPNISNQMRVQSKGHSRNKGRALASSGKRMFDNVTNPNLNQGNSVIIDN